jgi:hypothetical protein
MGQDWLQGMVHPDRLNDTRLCNAILDMIEGFSVERFEAQWPGPIERPDATPVLSNLTYPVRFEPLRQFEPSGATSRHGRLSTRQPTTAD